jgi:hypothetical protein
MAPSDLLRQVNNSLFSRILFRSRSIPQQAPRLRFRLRPLRAAWYASPGPLVLVKEGRPTSTSI